MTGQRCLWNKPNKRLTEQRIVNGVITVRLIEVDVDPLQLDVVVSLIDACCIDPVFLADHFPKLEKDKRER